MAPKLPELQQASGKRRKAPRWSAQNRLRHVKRKKFPHPASTPPLSPPHPRSSRRLRFPRARRLPLRLLVLMLTLPLTLPFVTGHLRRATRPPKTRLPSTSGLPRPCRSTLRSRESQKGRGSPRSRSHARGAGIGRLSKRPGSKPSSSTLPWPREAPRSPLPRSPPPSSPRPSNSRFTSQKTSSPPLQRPPGSTRPGTTHRCAFSPWRAPSAPRLFPSPNFLRTSSPQTRAARVARVAWAARVTREATARDPPRAGPRLRAAARRNSLPPASPSTGSGGCPTTPRCWGGCWQASGSTTSPGPRPSPGRTSSTPR